MMDNEQSKIIKGGGLLVFTARPLTVETMAECGIYQS